MIKDIKYLIEGIVNFNPVDYQEDPDTMIGIDTVRNITRKIPETKDDLIDLIKERIKNTVSDTLDLSDIDVSLIEDMSSLFSGWTLKNNSYIKTINFDGWNTENVVNMNCMFANCNTLKTLDLSMFNTKNVQDMGCMFSNCIELVQIDLSSFTTEKVRNLSYMFSKCKNLKSIDISHFIIRISNCDLRSMFKECKSLENIKIFKLPQTFWGKIDHMFNQVPQDIYHRDIISTNQMFNDYYFTIIT